VTATTVPSEVSRYLDAMRALLADLPADEREELLADLAVHLQEVSAETDEPLELTLGPPAAFAAELLASSGQAYVPSGRGWGWLSGLGPARRAWERVQASAATRWVRALLPELRPGWWVLRGYLGVLVVSEVLNGVQGDDFPVPSLLGTPILGLAAVVAAVVESVRLGRRRAEGRAARGERLLDTLIVLGALWAVFVAGARTAPHYVYVEDAHAGAPGVLVHPDGRTITNLYAYDTEGRLLEPVLLYDQDGEPVEVTADDDASTTYTEDGLPVETDYPLDVNGAQVRNAYPLDQRVERWRNGPDGSEQVVEVPVRPPAITTPRLPPGPASGSSSTTSTSTPTSTAAPEPAPAPAGSAPPPPFPPPAPGPEG
jgi:hypothetical protein